MVPWWTLIIAFIIGANVGMWLIALVSANSRVYKD